MSLYSRRLGTSLRRSLIVLACPHARVDVPHRDPRRGAAVLAGGFAVALFANHQRALSDCASTQRVPLGKIAEFEDGTMREIQVGDGGNSVLVHRHGGHFYVTSTDCSYGETQLAKGVTSAGISGSSPSVACSSHDATFDLATGMPTRGPALAGIATYNAQVVNGVVVAHLPTDIVSGRGKHQQVNKTMCGRDKKDLRTFAIVGGGPAALAAAETLRQEGFGGRLVMLTAESHLPYSRVQLSKALDQTMEKILLRPPSFFDACGIELKPNAVVTSVDAKGRTLQFQQGNAGEEMLKYDKVLIASGATPRKLTCPGATLRGVCTLRSPEDAATIASFARKGQNIVIVGGSFIGMEMASTLRKKGCVVSMVAVETIPFEQVLGKQVGTAFLRLLQNQGVRWFGSAQVRHFRGQDSVNGVELEDGEVLPADAVVVGAGALPNTQFVNGVSLDKNGGIVVGPLLCAEAEPSLFAAGDVCTFPVLATGKESRIEHWNVATQQGRTAAQNMLGKFVPFTEIPFFWSELFGKKLRFAGYAPNFLERVIVEGDVSTMEFIAYFCDRNEILAVATVDRDPVAVACAELMRRGAMPKVSELMVGTLNADVIMERLRSFSQAS